MDAKFVKFPDDREPHDVVPALPADVAGMDDGVLRNSDQRRLGKETENGEQKADGKSKSKPKGKGKSKAQKPKKSPKKEQKPKNPPKAKDQQKRKTAEEMDGKPPAKVSQKSARLVTEEEITQYKQNLWWLFNKLFVSM